MCLGAQHLSEQGENEELRSLKTLGANVLGAQHGRGKRGLRSPAQWTSEQTLLQVLEPQRVVQNSVQPGDGGGERGCSQIAGQK